MNPKMSVRSAVLAFLFFSSFCFVFAGNPSLVLFDQSHGELFSPMNSRPMDYSEFASLFEKEGFTMKIQSKPFSAADLAKASAFIISGSFQTFTPEEIKTLEAFVRNGGKLIMLLHVAPLVADVCQAFHIDVTNAIIHEQDKARVIENSDENFYLTDFVPHSLFYGVKKIGVFGVWGLLAEDNSARILGQTSSSAFADLNKNKRLDAADPVQAFGIIALASAGKGKVLVCGDDALFTNQFIGTADNRKFGLNVVRWISRGGNNSQNGSSKKS